MKVDYSREIPCLRIYPEADKVEFAELTAYTWGVKLVVYSVSLEELVKLRDYLNELLKPVVELPEEDFTKEETSDIPDPEVPGLREHEEAQLDGAA